VIAATEGIQFDGWALLGSLFLLVLNGFFVASEFALLAARRSRIEQLAAEGDTARRVSQYAMRPQQRIRHAAGLRRCASRSEALKRATTVVWQRLRAFREYQWSAEVAPVCAASTGPQTLGVERVVNSVPVAIVGDDRTRTAIRAIADREGRGVAELDVAEIEVHALAGASRDGPRGHVHLQHGWDTPLFGNVGARSRHAPEAVVGRLALRFAHAPMTH
jgi:hypothetical protein